MKVYQVGVILQEGDSYPYKTFANKEKAERYKLEIENKKKIEEDFAKGCDLCQMMFMDDTFKYQNNKSKLEQIATKMKQRCNSAVINVENGTKGWHMCDNERSYNIDNCGYHIDVCGCYLTEIEVEE